MRISLGAYPTDACYDPNRYSWLPYWIDDFTESNCKWGATNIVGATANAFGNPGQVAQNVGGVLGQGAGTTLSAVGQGITSGLAGIGSTLGTSGWFVVAGVAVLGLILLKRSL